MIFAAALFICVSPAIADEVQPTGESIVIGKIVIQVDTPGRKGKRVDWDGLVRDVIAIRPGETLKHERLQAATEALKAFGHVHIEVRPLAPEKAALHILLLPYQRIKTIAIKGAYPLFQRDIRNLMTIAPGDIYHPDTINKQAPLIEQRYQAEGYIEPKADITWQQDEDDGHIDVSIVIHKGDAYKLGKLKLTGNKATPDALILGMMSTWRASTVRLGTGRWVEARLKADIRALQTYYRNQGYADAQITYTVKRDPGRRKTDVRVTFNEGRRYEITYEGNHYYSNNALKKDLVLLKQGNRGNTGLRRTIQKIRRRYQKAGFDDVKVKWKTTDTEGVAAGERRIRIIIEEGERHRVSQVNISGNRMLSIEAIQAQMLTRPPNGFYNGAYSAAVLQEDVAAVEGLYRQSGYLNVRVSDTTHIDPETHRVTVNLSIDEGPQIRVGKIQVGGAPAIVSETMTAPLPLASGDVYQSLLVAENENEISARISAKGFPHVQVKTKVAINENNTRVDLVHTIDTGPRVQVGRIFWAGNFRTKKSLLRRELKLKEGQPFSLVEVLAAQRRLRDLDLFQSVQIRSIGLKEVSDKVHLLVTMVEKSSYFFELGLGYRTDKGVYQRTKLGDRNFLGLNKEIRLSGEVSGIGYRWDADLLEPSFLGTGLNIDLGFFNERKEEFNQDFGTDTAGGNLSFSRNWTDQIFTALNVRYERREQFLREGDAATTDVDPETLEPRTLWVTTPAIRWDSRDSFIQPRKGHLVSLAADLSKGIDSDLDDFVKYKIDLRSYYTPFSKLTLAGHAIGGYIEPYGQEGKIPEDQLLFLGGTNDVRGFGENLLRFNADKDPVGGRLAMAGSLEARYAVIQSWEVTVFVDAGTIRKALSGDDESEDNWQWTAGLGLRYLTPIGPVGVLYGHKLDPRPGESNGQVHVSIGYTF